MGELHRDQPDADHLDGEVVIAFQVRPLFSLECSPFIPGEGKGEDV